MLPLDAVLPAFTIALLGYLIGNKLKLDVSTLSRVCLYILTPALVFNAMSTSSIDFSVMWKLLLASLLMPPILSVCFLGIYKLLKWDKDFAKAMLLPTIFTNSGNYGLPICLFAFGPAGLELALVYHVAQTLSMAILGIYIAASGSMTPAKAGKQVLKMPALYAALAGLAVRIFQLPVPLVIDRPVALLGQAAVPIFLLVLGLQLVDSRGDNSWTPSLVIVGLRLIAAPILCLITGKTLGLAGLALVILVLEGAMPPPVNATILAREFNAYPKTISKATVIGTILSIISVSIWIRVLQGFPL